MLDESIQTAKNSLSNLINNLEKKFEKEFFISKWIQEMLDRKESIYKEIALLREEESKIDWLIRDLNPRISSDKFKEIKEEWYPYGDRNCNESDYYIWKNIKDTTEYKNDKNFSSIVKRFNQQMWFAISQKEQRSVLAEFYQLDWLSLWIEIPMDVRFDKITIEDWVIKVTQKLLD